MSRVGAGSSIGRRSAGPGRDGLGSASSWRLHLWLAVAVLAGVGLGGVGFGGVETAQAATPLSWSAPVLLDSQPPEPELDAVSCPTATLCVAVDRFGGIVSSTDPAAGQGAWSFAQVGSQTYKANTPCQLSALCLRSVSCASTTMCVAVGANGQVAVSTDPAAGAAAWVSSVVDEGHMLLGVSCVSSVLCVAVDNGGDVLTSTDPGGGASAWSTSHVDGQVLRAISCTAAPLCVAVDEVGDVVTSTDPTAGPSAWKTSEVDADTQLLAVSCVEERLCVAVGGDGQAVSSTEPTTGGWIARKLDGGIALGGVSCTSLSLCVAIDGAGNALTTSDPGSGVWVTSHIDAEDKLYSVSCSSATLCVGVNGHGNELSTTDPAGGAWAGAHVDSNDPPMLYGVSCPGRSLCAAADDAKNILSSEDPASSTGAWSASGLSAPTWGVSCATASLCVAGSGYDVLGSTEPAAGAGAWHVTGEYVQPIFPLPPHFAPHFRASCPSSSLCVAVEAFGDVLISTAPMLPGTWQPVSGAVFPLDTGPTEAENTTDPIFGISCPAVSLCVAVDSRGYVSITTDPQDGAQSRWSYADVDSQNAFEDISCPSVSLCVAVDQAGNVLSSTDPSGGAGAWRASSVDPGQAITGVSCPAVSLCVAVDEAGDVLSSSDPAGGAATWSLDLVDPGHVLTPIHALSGVSCASVSLCVAVDRAGYGVIGIAPEEGSSDEYSPGRGGLQQRWGVGEAPSSGKESPSNDFTILTAQTRRGGRIELRLKAPTAGSFRGTAVAIPTAKVARRDLPTGRHGHHERAARPITYGSGSKATRAPGTTTLVLAPHRLVADAFAVSRKLRLAVTVTFTPGGGSPRSKRLTLSVRR
jgi:hypothetical protein